MNRPAPARTQAGYLYEVPLLLMLLGIAVAWVFPQLSAPGRKLLVGAAVLPALLGLYYMLVTPGWLPAERRRLPRPVRLLLFLALAAAVLAGALSYVLSAEAAGR